jgi:hypothetical protein
MTLHLASSNEVRRILRDDSGLIDRDATVKQMADHLVAAILAGLNTASDIDVIEYLRHTPERYHSRTILDHLDDALLEAKQVLIAMEMSK